MADQTLSKHVNERNILALLRAEGAMLRADIARALKLTPATITRLTSDMLERGLLHEVEVNNPPKQRERGRPGVAIDVNPAGAYFLGAEIDIGAMRFVLMDLSTRVVESWEERVPRDLSPNDAAQAIARFFVRMQTDKRFKGRIHSSGVTVPGLVTLEGHVVNLPILGWSDVDFQRLLSEITILPVSVENDANAAAFGALYTQPELWGGCSVFLRLGTGCGGAAILNGRLLKGASGTGAELGHINVGVEGAICSCGRKGCLETWTNTAALARLYLGEAAESETDLLSLPARVEKAFEQGDPRAISAVDQIATHLATGLVSLVNVFNPSRVILGGIMLPLIRHRLDWLNTEVAKRIIPGTLVPEISPSSLGVLECAIGAACVSHHKAFDIAHIEIAAPSIAERPFR